MRMEAYIDLLIKGMVAFAIPLAWSFILYPLMIKVRKSWYSFIAMICILSLFTFGLKEILDKYIPDIDQFFAYILGIFFGIAALSYLFNFKHDWLRTLPKDKIFYDKHGINRKVDLCDVLQTAVYIEQEGKDFYDRLAKSAKLEGVRKICHKLAREEQRHKLLFLMVMFPWLPMPSEKEAISYFIDDLRKRGVFLKPPSPSASVNDMVKYIIKQKHKTADFYLSFEKSFPGVWKTTQVQTLVMEERAHVAELISAYPHLKETIL